MVLSKCVSVAVMSLCKKEPQIRRQLFLSQIIKKSPSTPYNQSFDSLGWRAHYLRNKKQVYAPITQNTLFAQQADLFSAPDA
jgi:hypothetical protein